jgi:hypothetical protein
LAVIARYRDAVFMFIGGITAPAHTVGCRPILPFNLELAAALKYASIC